MRTLIIFIIALISSPAFSWDLELRNANTTQPSELWVENENPTKNEDVYLVWFNLDAPVDDMFHTWQLDKGWNTGFTPVFDTRIDLPPFAPLAITQPIRQCDAQIRCFAAVLATTPDSDPLEIENWLHIVIHPLTAAAALERLPGQNVFFTDAGSTRIVNDGAVFSGAPEASTTDAAVPTSAPDNAADSSAKSITEKPDIFRLVNNLLLYANTQAQRFQVIDVSNPSLPHLQSELKLDSSPKELYVLNDFYVLLNNATQQTRFDVVGLDAQGQLQAISNLNINGAFIESRRRDDFIYSVSQDVTKGYRNAHLNLDVLQLDSLGHLNSIDSAQVIGYDPKVAIFQNHLAIANRDTNNWNHSLIQIFDLGQDTDPLVSLGQLKVSGQVPSEFHMSIQNQQLRVVYGPEDRSDGSTLAIYDLQQAHFPLIGKVDNIARGEQLFATRFSGDMAYVVTFEQTDPLWVIDLSDPSQPEIKGELIVPGWSERMFFNDGRLFAVGIDDQPASNENTNWARRASMSLFDVRNPSKPDILDRFTPLIGESVYSSSPALTDERALLLDWSRGFAALPVNSWQTGNHLQLVHFAEDKFVDLGRIDLNMEIERSLILDDNLLGILGDQAFVTADWAEGRSPAILGSLELARNLQWLAKEETLLWAAARNRQWDYHRFYAFDNDNLDVPMQTWALSQTYRHLVHDEGLSLFFNDAPFAVQILDREQDILYPAQQLELDENNAESGLDEDILVAGDVPLNVYQVRGSGFIHNQHFYLTERQEGASNQLHNGLFNHEKDPFYFISWAMNVWRIEQGTLQPVQRLSLPGEPLGFNSHGQLLLKETSQSGALRLHLASINNRRVTLLHSLDLKDCQYYAPIKWAGDEVYLNCQQFIQTPINIKPSSGSIGLDILQPENQWVTLLQRIQLNDRFLQTTGKWQVKNNTQLLAIHQDKVLLRHDSYFAYNDVIALSPVAANDSVAASQPSCHLYQIQGDELVSLTQLETCQYSYTGDNLVLDDNAIYQTAGFAGIQKQVLP